jgi:hypothetical protein
MKSNDLEAGGAVRPPGALSRTADPTAGLGGPATRLLASWRSGRGVA